MEKWYTVDKLGETYIENVLVFGNDPVLFVCIDSAGSRFLVENIDSFNGEFVIIPVSNTTLADFLSGKSIMYDVFKTANFAYVTCFDENFNLVTKLFQKGSLPDSLCPAKKRFCLCNDNVRQYVSKVISET